MLVMQLRPDSRLQLALDPRGGNTLEVQLLRDIEHNQRLWHWGNTKDAKNESTRPKRIQLPGEEEAHDKAVKKAQKEADATAKAFGIKL